MLSVPVQPDGRVVALLEREAKSRLHGATDADVEGQAEDDRPLPRCDLGRLVRGGVVHDHDVDLPVERADLVHDAPDRPGLVEGGHDRDDPAEDHEPILGS